MQNAHENLMNWDRITEPICLRRAAYDYKRIFNYYHTVMRSHINRNWPIAAFMGSGLIRFCFIACWLAASAIGSSIANAEIGRSLNCENRGVAFEQQTEFASSYHRASQTKSVMNENENVTIAKLNPKLGLILARLVRMQDQIPSGESGEPDHEGKPPIGMKKPNGPGNTAATEQDLELAAV